VSQKTSSKAAARLMCSPDEATSYIRDLVGRLQATDFAHIVDLPFDPTTVRADVYGVKNDDGTWYVKLHFEGAVMIVVSCHPPDYDLKLENGRILRRNK